MMVKGEEQDKERESEEIEESEEMEQGNKEQLTSEAIRKSLAKLAQQGEDVDVASEEEEREEERQEERQEEGQEEREGSIAVAKRRTTAPKKEFAILGPERNAELPEGVYGYLLPQLQAFFSQSMKTCTLVEKSTVLKPGVSCLLQKGIQTGIQTGENNKNQSFEDERYFIQ